MITNIGLVVLLVSGVLILVVSSMMCLRLLKRCPGSTAIILVWMMARISLLFVALMVLAPNKWAEPVFFAYMPAIALVYEIISLCIIRLKTAGTVKIDVYAQISQVAVLAVFCISMQAWIWGMLSIVVLTGLDLLGLMIKPAKTETDA